MEIRDGNPRDVESVQRIFKETWLSTYPNAELGITKKDILYIFEDAFSEEKLQARADFIKKAPRGLFAVAVEDNEIVGLCYGVVREKYNQVQMIYVLPEYQRRGVGKVLMDYVEKNFDREKDTVVHVATYNSGAIQFYSKRGFIDTGKRFSEERHRMPISRVLIPELEMVKKKA